jgi:uncharacterized protein (UPF0371 family)
MRYFRAITRYFKNSERIEAAASEKIRCIVNSVSVYFQTWRVTVRALRKIRSTSNFRLAVNDQANQRTTAKFYLLDKINNPTILKPHHLAWLHLSKLFTMQQKHGSNQLSGV